MAVICWLIVSMVSAPGNAKVVSRSDSGTDGSAHGRLWRAALLISSSSGSTCSPTIRSGVRLPWPAPRWTAVVTQETPTPELVLVFSASIACWPFTVTSGRDLQLISAARRSAATM